MHALRHLPRPKGRAPNPFLVWLKEIATVVVIAVVLSFLIKTFLFRAFYIPSESMVNTLDVNDRIFVNLLVPEPFALWSAATWWSSRTPRAGCRRRRRSRRAVYLGRTA